MRDRMTFTFEQWQVDNKFRIHAGNSKGWRWLRNLVVLNYMQTETL